jgi:hypothetical protein
VTATVAAAPRPPRPAPPPARRPAGDPTPAPGPLVAVCATSPGAGASTLSRLLALAAARDRGRVLLCRQPGPVTRAWAELTPGQRLGELFVRPRADEDHRREANRLRVLAVPAHPDADDAARFGRRLARARTRYALTVVDCATLGAPAERIALANATHLVWVLPATRDGLAHARRALRSTRPPAGARELLVARHDPLELLDDAVPALSRLAGERPAPLILAPHVAPRLSDAAALARAQVTLQALQGALTR